MQAGARIGNSVRCFVLSLALLAGAILFAKDPVPPAGSPPSPTNHPLEDKINDAPDKTKPADNSRCLVCHTNFDAEIMAMRHQKAGLGCVKCHGESKAHAADETYVIPPEIMIAKGRLNESCFKCHLRDKLSDDHTDFLAGLTLKKYCNECHGKHQLPQRRIRWDKDTGKLLSKEPVKE